MTPKQLSCHLISGLFFMVIGVETYNKVLEQNRYRYRPIVCRDDDCRTIANVILAGMNKTADPCEDFYEYTCGAWIHSNLSLPKNRATWNRMTMVKEEIAKKLRVVLESKNQDEQPVEKAKRWYRSCMNEEGLESRGIEPLTSLVNAVGGWPVSMALSEWNPLDYTWQEIELYYSRIMGSYALYDIQISPNRDNSSVNEIFMRAPKLPLSNFIQVPRHFFDLRDRQPYAKLIAGVAKAFAVSQGVRVSDEKIAREVNDIIEFEIEIDKFKNYDAVARHSIAVIHQVLDLEMPGTEISKINLLTLIQNMVGGVGGIEINDDEVVSVEAFYLVTLGPLLNKTSAQTIVNYVHWHYLSRMLHATNSEMIKLLLEFEKKTIGIREPLPRWEQCVGEMKLNHALSYQFVRDHFTEKTYKAGSEMISLIRTELERQINGSTWMEEKTKNAWKEKLRNMKALMGFPDWYKNATNLEEYYQKLTVGNDYFNNHLNYMRFAAKKMMQTLRSADGQPEWLSDPITVNAIYIMNANSLNIPAADFQPPLFTPTMPNAVKYGIIGSMLGHELSHGFDDTGSHFDKDGKMIERPIDVKAAYPERISCFIKQYNNFTDTSSITNVLFGIRTVSENIVDTNGVQSALGAYRNLVRKDVIGDRKLSGLEDLTNEQLFFLSYATIWCDISTPEYTRKRMLSEDPHSPSHLRVLAALSNTDEFAEAFNCPVGSVMNPANKCNIWT